MFICPYKDVNGHQMVWLHTSKYICVFSMCFLKTEKDKQVWNDMGGGGDMLQFVA